MVKSTFYVEVTCSACNRPKVILATMEAEWGICPTCSATSGDKKKKKAEVKKDGKVSRPKKSNLDNPDNDRDGEKGKESDRGGHINVSRKEKQSD